MKKIDYVRKETEYAGIYELLKEMSYAGSGVVQDVELTQNELDRFQYFFASNNRIYYSRPFDSENLVSLDERLRKVHIQYIDEDIIKLCVCSGEGNRDYYPKIKYTIVEED